jgi:hypothetical protein
MQFQRYEGAKNISAGVIRRRMLAIQVELKLWIRSGRTASGQRILLHLIFAQETPLKIKGIEFGQKS